MVDFADGAAMEARKHPRAKTNLPGRYMLPDRREYACTVIDVSAGGVALLGHELGTIGDRVIVYIEKLGRIEGEIVRFVHGGFALKFTGSTRAAQSFVCRLSEIDGLMRL
jgi:hypothetical protein